MDHLSLSLTEHTVTAVENPGLLLRESQASQVRHWSLTTLNDYEHLWGLQDTPSAQLRRSHRIAPGQGPFSPLPLD